MTTHIAEWRNRIKHRIRQQYPSGLRYDAEAEERFAILANLPVPSDEELIAMQKRGEFPSDEELSREGHQ